MQICDMTTSVNGTNLKLFIGMPSSLKLRPEIVSAIARQPVDQLNVYLDRIEGDEVANKIHHGGPHRVLHQYPREHYASWKLLYPAASIAPGLIGENISSEGMTEKDVCVGDIFEIGNVVCVVTEPRKPCATINQQFGVQELARKTQNESKTGWFYKILRPGVIKPSDQILLKERKYPTLTLDVCIQALLVKPNKVVLKQMTECDDLSDSWKRPAANYLASNFLADDRARLGEV